MNSKVRDGGSWRRKGGERRSQMVAPINRKKKKQKKQETGSRITEWLTADWPTNMKWKNRADHSPYRWRQKCTTALGSKVMRQPCRQEDVAQAKERGGRAEIKERRDKEKEERDNAAPNVIMQWTGSAIGGGARCFFNLIFLFLFFQPVRWRGGVRRSCPTPGWGPGTGQPLKGTHTQDWTRRVYVRK